MSRFGVNIVSNLPPTRISNHSPLLKGLQWPNDAEYIAALHGENWLFYLTAWVRRHIVTHSSTLFTFTARDSDQALPYIADLMKLFNPISLLSLYCEALDYYKNCVVNELLPFKEQWYLSIVRSYYTLEDFEADDWFWRFALRQVMWLPRKGLPTLQNKLSDWVLLPGKSQHSGVPEALLQQRFPDCTTRIQGVYQVISNDLKGTKPPTVASEGAWGAMAGPDSPFLHAVPDIDHFLLSLYQKKPDQTFAWSMAVDIIQHAWTLCDWKHNVFSTKWYNQLASNDKVLAFNTPTINQNAAAIQSGASLQNGIGGKQRVQLNDPTNPQHGLQYEPQPFHDLRIKIQLLAADMVFDYCSDHELKLLVSDLDTLVRNSNFPRQGRQSYYVILKHLKGKIDVYNMIQTNSNESGIDNNINDEQRAHGNVDDDSDDVGDVVVLKSDYR